MTYDLLLRPLYNILLICLQLFQGNLGRAIIVLTLITRLIVAQFTGSPTAMQEQMGAMQPKMQAIQDQYKDNPEKQSEEMMNLLKKE